MKEYAKRRNTVLFARMLGGLGDIFMHCYMFEDIKALDPNMRIVWAVPRQYRCIAEMHKFVDEAIDIETLNIDDYIIYYNTTTACRDHECKIAPLADKHRSDIWANHCGIYLRRHNLNLNLAEKYLSWGQKTIEKWNKKDQPTLLISPISSTLTKDLQDFHLEGIVKYARKKGLFVFGTHEHPVPILAKLDVPTVCGTSIEQWMGVVNAADYVMAVDTSTVHYAGGLGKPTVGIFTYADGRVYGKYNPRFELVQLHRDNGGRPKCPCYTWGTCPYQDGLIKPCITEITVKMLSDALDSLLEKYSVR